MTLFIAYVVMNHVGGFDAFHYVCAFILWVGHLGFHDGGRDED